MPTLWLSKKLPTFILILLLIPLSSQAQAANTTYKPIVLVHGVMADQYSMLPTEKFIYKHMPGTYVKNITLGINIVSSFFNMYSQVDWLRREIENDPLLNDGFNMIAHSQGGLVARYYIARYNTPRVHNFITWGTPHQGVCGTPGAIDNRFIWLNFLELHAYKVLYSHMFQQYFSAAGYWRDTLHYGDYIKQCRFLPYLNNEIKHSYSTLFKANMCSLQNFVMVASTQEEIIEPAASCHFGFYKIGSTNEIEPLQESREYQQDVLGLKTLNESGRLHFRVTQAIHADMQESETNFLENTLPFLTIQDQLNMPYDAIQNSTITI